MEVSVKGCRSLSHFGGLKLSIGGGHLQAGQETYVLACRKAISLEEDSTDLDEEQDESPSATEGDASDIPGGPATEPLTGTVFLDLYPETGA
jgi:hypothetical protein